MLGYSSYKKDTIQHTPIKMKTSYQSSFNVKNLTGIHPTANNSFVFSVEKGIPNQTNYLSECYPSIPMSENSC